MAHDKNKEQLMLIDLGRRKRCLEYNEPITLDRVIEQFCLEHKISNKKLRNYFNFFWLGDKIYMISKKAGIDIEPLKSKEHEEIINALSELKGKTTRHHCCDFSYADLMYNINFFNFTEYVDREFSKQPVSRHDKYKSENTEMENFENEWGNIVKIAEKARY